MAGELLHQRRGTRFPPDHPAERADHAEDIGHAAMVEDVHLDARTHQLRRDVRLQVGEPQHQVRFQREDPVDLGAREGRHARLLLARSWRTHGETGNADDAPVFTEQVERLGGLFGETDDALWKFGRHAWLAKTYT